MRDDYSSGDDLRRHHGGRPGRDSAQWGCGPRRFHHDAEHGAQHHGAGSNEGHSEEPRAPHAHGPHEHGEGGPGFEGYGPRGFGGYGRRGFGPSFDPRGFDAAALAAFGARGRKRASRGDIRAAILSLLADGP
jgi:hypothetical protein